MGLRTTPKTAHAKTPFSLAFGSKAVVPVETGVPMMRINRFDRDQNEMILR